MSCLYLTEQLVSWHSRRQRGIHHSSTPISPLTCLWSSHFNVRKQRDVVIAFILAVQNAPVLQCHTLLLSYFKSIQGAVPICCITSSVSFWDTLSYNLVYASYIIMHIIVPTNLIRCYATMYSKPAFCICCSIYTTKPSAVLGSIHRKLYALVVPPSPNEHVSTNFDNRLRKIIGCIGTN